MGIADLIREKLKIKNEVTLQDLVKELGMKEDEIFLFLNYMLKKNEIELIIRQKKEKVHGEVAEKIWRAVRLLKRFTAKDILKISGVKHSVVKNYLNRLKYNGVIQVIGNEKGRYVYELKKDSPIRPAITKKVKNANK